MIVYVKSNFPLAIARWQEDAAPAIEILEMAERGEITVAFPAAAAIEPFSTVSHRGRERRRLNSMLNQQLRELARSQPHQTIVPMLRPVPPALSALEKIEFTLLQHSVRRLFATGRPIDLDVPILDRAVTFRQTTDLSPRDAIVFASVVEDLALKPTELKKCFVSTNWKDFRAPDRVAVLRAIGCIYARSFQEAITIIAGWRGAPSGPEPGSTGGAAPG